MTAKGSRPGSGPALTEIVAGRYRVERELGRGGMATVYLCTDLEKSGLVAVKFLRTELVSAVVVERFLREIDFASQLDHPQIPKVFDSGVFGELPFYVMSYIEGESLRAKLDREKQLTIEEAIRITQQVIDPMAYAHARGIVHRDIKPANILLANDGVYVLDFGIARAIIASAGESLTSTGVAVGTPAYMSPEQALADGEVDSRSDIYSLACVTYEMIAGIPPFVGATAQAVMARRFVAPPPPLKEVREHVPAAVEHAVGKALSRAPADRWQHVQDFGRALSASPSQASTEAHVDDRRRNLGRWLAATLGVVIVAGGGWAWNSTRGATVLGARKDISAWDLDAGESRLRQVVKKNPDDSEAHVWLAQVRMLRGDSPADWNENLLAAAESKTSLSPASQLRLSALVNYNGGKFTAACEQFDDLRSPAAADDRKDQTATLSLADCLRENAEVVSDLKSPSGFRFVSSYHLADSLYEALLNRSRSEVKAFRHVVPRLQRVLSVDVRMLRQGRLSGKPQLLVAQPELVADTLAYVPYPISPTGDIPNLGQASALQAAVTRNGARLRQFVGKWTSVDPEDAAAHETLAALLESSGELDGPEPSALTEMRKAREYLAISDSTVSGYVSRTRAANSHVRLLVRLGRYSEAAAIADSTLAAIAPSEIDDKNRREVGGFLWRLAALRGRGFFVNTLEQQYASAYRVRLPSGIETPPPAISRDVIGLTNYAAFGAPRDSILVLTRRLLVNIAALVPPNKVAAMRNALLTRPLSIAVPVTGPKALLEIDNSGDLLVRAQRAYALRQRALAQTLLDSLVALHADRPPGEITMDVTYQQAWLTVQLADTVNAERLLDNALLGISKGPPSMLSTPLLIASFVRAMVLRSELAEKRHDPVVARKWSKAAFDLWGKGDPEIRSIVGRMSQRRPL